MPASPDPQLLDALDPVARRAGPRVRIAVGAAVVLFVVAVAAAAMLSFAATGGGGQGRIDAVESEAADAAGHHASVEEVATTPLLVHVLGAVVKPGLVELAAGSRVVDAVAAAGGFTAEADPAGVNLARPVVDGEQLVVLAIGQVPPPGPAAGSAADSSGSGTAGDGVVHLNTADLAALDTLPRIGPALAQRIIDWRDANGPFTSVEQLLEVTGIGDAVFAGLVDRVSL